ncbi:hypothetical protein LCGC14_0422220 [marine sediment metagenome]|uniref:Uncharacterized protein n=1 Tax=marine sediment metagenome TaxID=412755 RepID=A0A0F9T8N6_9ZZZZ
MSIEVDILDVADAKASSLIFISNHQDLLTIYTEDDAEFLESVLGFRSEFGYIAPLLDIYQAKVLLRKFNWTILPEEIPNHLAYYLFRVLKIKCRKYRQHKYRKVMQMIREESR